MYTLAAKVQDVELGSGSPMSNRQSVSSFMKQREPKDFTWNTVNFTVNQAGGTKSILKDCWGNVPSGNLCAVMGPSGSGKSSLLNVLAGRSSSAPGITVAGKIRVGGILINPVAYRRNIAYVMQDDALLATSTPREKHLSSPLACGLTRMHTLRLTWTHSSRRSL